MLPLFSLPFTQQEHDGLDALTMQLWEQWRDGK